ncbi:MAG: hypothetical protein LBD16_05610 [Oscillospiraceae bacterium]|jgi:hypothetical protein|nr:hypothetical protein [Oscillospiraceae bacterium]
MNKLPEVMPKYTITPKSEPPFFLDWEEILGWFFIPKLGEKLSWAIYDQPSGERREQYATESVGRAVIHGIEGVEVAAVETRADGSHGTDRTFVAQLTEAHSRILAESHVSGGVRHFYTFLDGDDFLPNWGFGEDNCGNDIHPVPKDSTRNFVDIQKFDAADSVRKYVLRFKSRNYSTVCTVDVKSGGSGLPATQIAVGRFDVAIGGKAYDAVCVVDVESYNGGVLSETYLDANGRTVLWRRFNRDDWHIDKYGEPWSERLPENERLTVNDATYVHWYDCITDYIAP